MDPLYEKLSIYFILKCWNLAGHIKIFLIQFHINYSYLEN